MANLATLTIQCVADVRQATRDIEAFGTKAAAALGAVSTAATAAALVLDDALDGIRVATGKTGAALQSLERSFTGVFKSGPSGAAEVSEAVRVLGARSDATGQALDSLARQVLTVSRITKTDLSSNLQESTDLFRSWGIAVAGQEDALNRVFRASQAAGVGFDVMLGALVRAGPTLRGLGLDLSTSAALLGAFDRAGISTEKATAGLSTAVRNLAKAGAEPGPALQAVLARIRELGPSAEATALGVKVFGRSAVEMVAAVQSGTFDVRALVAAINSGQETIQGAAAATDGFTETLAELRNRATAALSALATPVLEKTNAAMRNLMDSGAAVAHVLHRLAQAATIGATAYGVHLAAGVLAATRAKIGAAVAAHTAARALAQETGAALVNARAAVQAAVAQVQLARAEATTTGSTRALTVALATLSAAQRSAGIAAQSHSAALAAASIRARVAAAAMNGLRGVLAWFGGPIGLAITVALAAIGTGFLNTGRKARQAAAQMEEAAERARNALAAMDDAAVTQTFTGAVETSTAWMQKVREQEAITQALDRRRDAGEAIVRLEQRRRGGEIDFVAVPTDFGRELEQARQRLADYRTELTKAREAQERAGAESFSRIQQQTQFGPLPDITGNIPDFGAAADQAEKKRAQSLRSHYTKAIEEIQGRLNKLKVPDNIGKVLAEKLNTLAEQFTVRMGAAGQVLSDKLTSAADKISQAMKQGAEDAARRLQAASDNLRSLWGSLLSGLPQQVRNFADAFRVTSEARDKGDKGVLAALPPTPAAFAFMAAAEALAPVLEALRQPFLALMEPVRVLSAAFSPLLTSLLEATFPIIKVFAIGLTWLAQVVGYVGGAIFKVVGEVVAAVGDLISRIPGLKQEGRSVEKFGRGLVASSEELFKMADNMPKVRRELEGLSWDEAMKRATDGANKLADSLSNVPQVFDLALRRMQAARSVAVPSVPAAPTIPASSPAPRPPSVPSGGGGTGPGGTVMHLNFAPGAIVVPEKMDGSEFGRQFMRYVESQAGGGGASRLGVTLNKIITAR